MSLIDWFNNLPTFGVGHKPKRQRRYVLNVQRDLPVEYLMQILQMHTPVISAREYNRLPAHLKALFIQSRKS